MNKSYTTDIIIVGGGIAGLSLALLLEKNTNYRICIVEREHKNRSRVSAVNHLSICLWKFLGVWEESLALSYFYHMHLWNDLGGVLDIEAPYLSNEALGAIIEDQHLHEHLLARVNQSSQIRILNQQHCLEIFSESEQVSLQTETMLIHAQYLVACDGAHSWVREQGAFPLKTWHHDETAIIANITMKQSHRYTAYQKFTQEGPLAFLPLKNCHETSIVWSLPTPLAKERLALSDADFLQILQQTSEGLLGDFIHTSARLSFPLFFCHSQDYVKQSLILCADSAHSIHPMAGQGLNLGIKDIISLTESFMSIESKQESSVKALRRYERAAKTENAQMIFLLQSIKRLHETRTPALQETLRYGLGLINRSSTLKTLMAKLANGKNKKPSWLVS